MSKYRIIKIHSSGADDGRVYIEKEFSFLGIKYWKRYYNYYGDTVWRISLFTTFNDFEAVKRKLDDIIRMENYTYSEEVIFEVDSSDPKSKPK